MKPFTIYELTYSHTDDGACLSFHPSNGDAQAALVHAVETSGGKVQLNSGFVRPLTVNPTKAGILQLLKWHCPEHDNG